MHPENPTITNQYIKLNVFILRGRDKYISLHRSVLPDISAPQNLIKAVSKVIL